MEDIHLTAECPHSRWIVWAVCDGHGGTGVVKKLSTLLVPTVLGALSKLHPGAGPVRPNYLRQYIREVIVALDRTLERECTTSALRNSGSTLILMAYQPLTRQIVLVNVGDSRAVLSFPSQGGVEQLVETKDHKPSDKEETMRVLAAGSHVTHNRVGGILALSRAMGDFSLKHTQTESYNPVGGAVCAVPDVQVGHLSPTAGATAILACDGIWDVMKSKEAIGVVESTIAGASKTNPAEFLVQTAFQKGSSDNLTALVVHLHPQRRLGSGARKVASAAAAKSAAATAAAPTTIAVPNKKKGGGKIA
jgi:protein phosphatase PTC2/3